MAENVVDLVSTPPPPSATKITEELIPQHLSVIPLDLCKKAMLEAMKEKYDRDRDLQAYIEKLPEIFTTLQKISTKAPLFEAGGSKQPGQVLQRLNTFATVTSNFERNPKKEAKFITCRITSITLTTPEPHPPAPKPTRDEEGENMEDIS